MAPLLISPLATLKLSQADHPKSNFSTLRTVRPLPRLLIQVASLCVCFADTSASFPLVASWGYAPPSLSASESIVNPWGRQAFSRNTARISMHLTFWREITSLLLKQNLRIANYFRDVNLKDDKLRWFHINNSKCSFIKRLLKRIPWQRCGMMGNTDVSLSWLLYNI